VNVIACGMEVETRVHIVAQYQDLQITLLYSSKPGLIPASERRLETINDIVFELAFYSRQYGLRLVA
jgi:hypothetical protein